MSVDEVQDRGEDGGGDRVGDEDVAGAEADGDRGAVNEDKLRLWRVAVTVDVGAVAEDKLRLWRSGFGELFGDGVRNTSDEEAEETETESILVSG